MKRMVKNIASALVAFLVATTLAAPALAAGPKSEFTNLTDDSPYYETVEYFVGKGVIADTKDGLRSLKKDVTAEEWASILAGISEMSEVEVIEYMEELKKASDTSDVSMPVLVYNSIWKAAGIKTYTASEYGYSSKLDAGTTAMLTTGLIDRDAVKEASISRGEALRLLYEVAVKKFVTEVPDNLISFFDVFTDCEKPDETEALLRDMLKAYPNAQLALMLAYDYDFEVWDDLSGLPVEDSELLWGMEDDGAHTIYIEKDAISEWLLHEVGHAVETCNSSYSVSIALFKSEKTAGVELMGLYAGVNSSEFIAEATSYYVKNQNNEAEIAMMQETMPQTYGHLTNVMSRSPFLSEAYFLNIVCPE